MFVYSVRASGVRFFAILALTLALLVAITLGTGAAAVSASGSGEAVFTGIRTEEDRVAFLKSFGIEVKGGAVEELAFVMPENFDAVLLGYNQIQRSQGLDLSKYARKRVTRYTYEVANYEGYTDTVYANLLIYKNRIIGCDVSSQDPHGFVEPIVK